MMSAQRKSLASFLNSAKATLNTAVQQSTGVTFVIGNESADLDSLCSAVVLAYVRTHSGHGTVHVPLCNLARADLELRPELRPVLSRARLEVGDLITLSDLPGSGQRMVPATALDPAKTRWILVDHNALQGELGRRYSDRVVGVIDHHDEENQVPKDCAGEPRIVIKSGSCTSLVVEYCRGAWDTLAESSTGDSTAAAAAAAAAASAWDGELAHLALAPILIDTNNVKDASKVTQADKSAISYLESRLAASSVEYDRDDYFREISAAKADVGRLSLPDILRKDYKQWTESGGVNLGISSVVKALPFLVEKAGGTESALLDSMRAFATDRKLSVFALMTTSTSTWTSPSSSTLSTSSSSPPAGELARELLVLSLDDTGAKATATFQQNATHILGLKSWGMGRLDCQGGEVKGGTDGHQQQEQEQQQSGWSSHCWVQERVENSRKQVGPLLRTALNDAVFRAQQQQ